MTSRKVLTDTGCSTMTRSQSQHLPADNQLKTKCFPGRISASSFRQHHERRMLLLLFFRCRRIGVNCESALAWVIHSPRPDLSSNYKRARPTIVISGQSHSPHMTGATYIMPQIDFLEQHMIVSDVMVESTATAESSDILRISLHQYAM